MYFLAFIAHSAGLIDLKLHISQNFSVTFEFSTCLLYLTSKYTVSFGHDLATGSQY
jgi:hypothetical protein